MKTTPASLFSLIALSVREGPQSSLVESPTLWCVFGTGLKLVGGLEWGGGGDGDKTKCAHGVG